MSFGGVASAGCLTIQVAPHGLIRVAHLQEVAAAGWLMHNFEVLPKPLMAPHSRIHVAHLQGVAAAGWLTNTKKAFERP